MFFNERVAIFERVEHQTTTQSHEVSLFYYDKYGLEIEEARAFFILHQGLKAEYHNNEFHINNSWYGLDFYVIACTLVRFI